MTTATADRPTTDEAPAAAPTGPRQRTLWQRMQRARAMYVFIVPGMIFFVVFAYIPLLGNVVAFQDFSPFRGIAGSRWVGLENFAGIFADPEVLNAIKNTLIISLLQILFSFPAPILLALLLNSLISEKLRRFLQSIVYLPHFISWVIVISIWQQCWAVPGRWRRCSPSSASNTSTS